MAVSIGVAHGTASRTFATRYDDVDRALYAVKMSERNSVVFRESDIVGSVVNMIA